MKIYAVLVVVSSFAASLCDLSLRGSSFTKQVLPLDALPALSTKFNEKAKAYLENIKNDGVDTFALLGNDFSLRDYVETGKRRFLR